MRQESEGQSWRKTRFNQEDRANASSTRERGYPHHGGSFRRFDVPCPTKCPGREGQRVRRAVPRPPPTRRTSLRTATA